MRGDALTARVSATFGGGTGAAARAVVAGVWLVHGLYNKLLGGSLRHLAIVQAVPGLHGAAGARVLAAVGVCEVAIAVWVIAGVAPRLCAAAQSAALLSMNVVELTFARPLLLWPAGLIPVNLLFLSLAWLAALTPTRSGWRARLRRHPIPIRAHFRECITLTYAVPSHVLRPLLPPGLELDSSGEYGFVAVALVQTESLRPAGLPRLCGRDFFLAGYRVFTTFRAPDGRTLRGLRILRSDADRTLMVAGGNLLTHYNYYRCDAHIEADADRIDVQVRTADGRGDLELTANVSDATLPAASPFASVRDARRYAGPLPYTFDYEAETHSIIAIEARRVNWKPAPIAVDVRRIAFFDQPTFRGRTPVLAAAFRVTDIDYRWARGVRYPLRAIERERAS